MRQARKSVVSAMATVLLAGLLLVVPGRAAAPADAAVAKPVINGSVFNDPLGTAAQQRAIFDQLIRLIDATPPGQDIRGAVFDFTDKEVADHLLAAFQRGVRVKILIDDTSYAGKTSAAWNELKLAQPTGLGTNDALTSWIETCGVARGCLGTSPSPAYMHNKFFTFSQIGDFADGTSYAKVVFQTSSNLGPWYKTNSMNDSVTFVDADVYAGYVTYHADMNTARKTAAGNNSYYRSTPTGGTYRAYFFPRGDPDYHNPDTDTVVNILQEVSCSYIGPDGARHQADIRVIMQNINDSRSQVAVELAAKRAQGCWVDVVYGLIDSGVKATLTNADVSMHPCAFTFQGRGVRPHNKLFLIDGAYNGDTTPRVYTGSPNFDGSSLRSSDQALMRITSATYHASYLSYFYSVRKQCDTSGA